MTKAMKGPDSVQQKPRERDLQATLDSLSQNIFIKMPPRGE